jgi:hypothetical protein
MLVKLDADLSVIFGTQLFLRKQFLDPVTNAGLEKAVRARAAAQPGVKVSNTGGWQSEPDLFDWQEPEVASLAAELDRAIQQFVSFGQAAPVRLKIRRAGWANVNRAGDYNSLHNHPQQHLAAATTSSLARLRARTVSRCLPTLLALHGNLISAPSQA